MNRATCLLLAVLLLLATGALHYGIDPLAATYADPAAARRALFYVGQGLHGALLPGVLMVLALQLRRLYAVPLVLVCVWAIAEQALVAGCRLARGIEQVPDLPLWAGMCTSVTGQPTYLLGAVLGGIAAASILYEVAHGLHQDRRR